MTRVEGRISVEKVTEKGKEGGRKFRGRSGGVVLGGGVEEVINLSGIVMI